MKPRVVIDTNVFVGACLGARAANQVLQACLQGLAQPLMGVALLAQYEDVLQRPQWAAHSPLSAHERAELLDIFLACCAWTRVYYHWRPNLPDEADNHLIELAVAGGARYVLTRNLRDVARGELRFTGLQIMEPATFLKEMPSWPH